MADAKTFEDCTAKRAPNRPLYSETTPVVTVRGVIFVRGRDMAATQQAASVKVMHSAMVHPAWVRITHWLNAVAMLVMIGSGWQIYNASPLFDFTFSRSITLGGWLAGALQWHFAAMWLLMVNGLVYVVLGFATGRFRKKLLPITPGGVISDTRAALTGRLSNE